MRLQNPGAGNWPKAPLKGSDISREKGSQRFPSWQLKSQEVKCLRPSHASVGGLCRKVSWGWGWRGGAERRQRAWKRPSLFESGEASLNFVTALVEFDLQLRISRPPQASRGREARVINCLCFPAWVAGFGRLRPQRPTPKGGELGDPTPESERGPRGLATL